MSLRNTRRLFVSFLSITAFVANLLLVTSTDRTAFSAEAFSESTIRDTEATEGLDTAQSALESIDLPAGFRATLFASEPLIRQPIAMTSDTRGRLWIAENYTYAEEPLGFDASLRDRIIILEDNDHDGVADSRVIFWDEAEKLTSIEIGLGGVWALCPPNLLFIPDADGDDRPDGKPEVILTGWDDDKVRHNVVNGLRWGPDGWLYGRHGILRTSQVGLPGAAPSDRIALNCSIWRYHPLRKVFEVVTHGTTNPWGMDWDKHGQMFFINTVIGHLWHVVPGAHYERMYGEDMNPHLYGLIPQTADHFHWDRNERWLDIRELGVTPTTGAAGGGHAHSGLMIYQGDNWPADYRGHVFDINFHGRRLNQDILSRHGAGFTARHGSDLLQIGDPWFRGIDLRTGADGSVFLTDWTDAGECHDSDGVHRNSGRVFNIAYGEPDQPLVEDVSRLPGDELVELLASENVWYARRARRVLQDRFAIGHDLSVVHKQLHRFFDSSQIAAHRLQAMWSLHVTEGDTTEWLAEQLGDDDENVRTWATRLVCDSRHYSPEVAALLTKHVAHENSGLVLLFAASGLQQMSIAERWPLAIALGKHGEFASDPALPLMVWYGIEAAVFDDTEQAVQLALSTNMPLLRRHLARRMASELPNRQVAFDLLLRELADSDDSEFQLEVFNGIATALKGRRNVPMPSHWTAVREKYFAGRNGLVRQLAREAAIVFGDTEAIEELRHLVQSQNEDLIQRRTALAALIATRPEDLAQLLHNLIDTPELALEAVRGLASINNDQTPVILLSRYSGMKPAVQQQVISTLASHPVYATVLLEAIENDQISGADVGAFEIRQMWSFDDRAIQDRLQRLWPQVRPTSAEKAQQIQRFTKLLSEDRINIADRAQGRIVFEKACSSCHQLFGNGGKVGPDLTGGQRNNLFFLLHNILDPSAQVADNYRMSIVVLDTGRVVTGVIINSNDHTLTLQTATEILTIDQTEVGEVQLSELSIMPEQILNTLSDEQVCDLIAYLMSVQQVPLPTATSHY